MADKISFTKHEHDVLREFRKRLGFAESSEDVKKFFDFSMRQLFKKVFAEDIDVRIQDCAFSHTNDTHFELSSRLLASELFTDTWDRSDLPSIVKRFAVAANKRHIHLEKHQEKTSSKIRG